METEILDMDYHGWFEVKDSTATVEVGDECWQVTFDHDEDDGHVYCNTDTVHLLDEDALPVYGCASLDVETAIQTAVEDQLTHDFIEYAAYERQCGDY